MTVNIVNPGAGANTPGMAVEMRARSAAAAVPLLVEPEDMVGRCCSWCRARRTV